MLNVVLQSNADHELDLKCDDVIYACKYDINTQKASWSLCDHYECNKDISFVWSLSGHFEYNEDLSFVRLTFDHQYLVCKKTYQCIK